MTIQQKSPIQITPMGIEEKCPTHNEPLADHHYKNNIGYCDRCKTWYAFEGLE